MTAPGSVAGAPNTNRIGDEAVAVPNRTHQHYVQWFEGDGSTTEFILDKTPTNPSQVLVFVDGALCRPNERGTTHDYALSGQRITFTTAPGESVNIGCYIVAP